MLKFDTPSPAANATNDCGIATGLSPNGARRAGPDSKILPRPIGGEAGAVSFRGRVRDRSLSD